MHFIHVIVLGRTCAYTGPIMTRCLPLLALALTSCKSTGDSGKQISDCDGPVITAYDDADFDGYGDPDVIVEYCEGDEVFGVSDNGDDCDDRNVSIHPAAIEQCNGVDDDCDGAIDVDDEVEGAPVWFEDRDGDGFGNPDSSRSMCDWPSGWVNDSSDCDDNDPTVSPGAEEYCDSTDNDCDGVIDNPEELVVELYYADVDGDGYGDPDTETPSCQPLSGYVLNDLDCDDGDLSIYPNAYETCGDKIDSDCDNEDCLDWSDGFEKGSSLGADWSTSGSANWSVVSSGCHEGTNCAQGGNINHSQSTSMSVTLEYPEPGSISFWYKVSSESNYDYLQFYLDGVRQAQWSGTTTWAQQTYSVSTGTHTMEWRYTKDGSVDSGSDTAWVDLVEAANGHP